MKNLMHLLSLNSVFSDLTIDLNNFDVGTNNIVLADEVDYLYSGLYKPFRNLFVSVLDNTVAGTLTLEYFNGTAWVSLSVIDETANFSRSGFITWDLPSDWVETTVDGKSGFFIRFTGNIEFTLNGSNMVLSNDSDLKEHYRQINEYLGDDLSFVALHQASRKDIIQDIRNSGKVKVSSIDGLVSDLTIWDFNRPEQLRNASTYLTLSKIFAGVSDSSDGKFFQLSRSFKKSYRESLDTFLLSVDTNDDGKDDSNESSNITRIITL